jgi:hypothetical protein
MPDSPLGSHGGGMVGVRVRLGLAAVFASSLSLAGCGSPSTGTVVGIFADLHGPYATGTLAFAGTVTLVSPSRSYSVDVGPSGHFTVQVEPGTYRVSGVSPTYHGPTCSGGSVLVNAGQQVTVNVSCLLS